MSPHKNEPKTDEVKEIAIEPIQERDNSSLETPQVYKKRMSFLKHAVFFFILKNSINFLFSQENIIYNECLKISQKDGAHLKTIALDADSKFVNALFDAVFKNISWENMFFDDKNNKKKVKATFQSTAIYKAMKGNVFKRRIKQN